MNTYRNHCYHEYYNTPIKPWEHNMICCKTLQSPTINIVLQGYTFSRFQSWINNYTISNALFFFPENDLLTCKKSTKNKTKQQHKSTWQKMDNISLALMKQFNLFPIIFVNNR